MLKFCVFHRYCYLIVVYIVYIVYIYTIEIKKTKKMRFWHIVTDKEGVIREQFLVGNSNKRFSLECSAKILNGTYDVIPQSEYNI